jgi:hypothetical protein
MTYNGRFLIAVLLVTCGAGFGLARGSSLFGVICGWVVAVSAAYLVTVRLRVTSDGRIVKRDRD